MSSLCLSQLGVHFIEDIAQRFGWGSGLVEANLEVILDLKHELDGGQ
jgi:hypothetical protein